MDRQRILGAARVSLAIGGLSLILTWLVPILAEERGDALADRALETCRRIAAAVSQYREDTGFAPSGPLGDGSKAWLHGNGVLPSPNVLDRGESAPLDTFLVAGNPAITGESWRGPYLRPVEPDPWGRAYVVDARSFPGSSERIWVVSAGPDGSIETRAEDSEPRGDDVGAILAR